MVEDIEKVTQINWLQQLAKDYLKEKRRARRYKWIARIIIFILILLAFIFIPVTSSGPSVKKKHVAVINLEGGIFAKSRANADKFIKALELAFKNKNAKAVLININSPGGSPVQADEMYQAIMMQRKSNPKKKVIAVCSEMCASAAYYVASAADSIYANPSSVVGSIGVISSGFGFTGLMDKVGVSRRVFTSGLNKSFLDPFSPEKSQDKEKLQLMLNIIHDEFKNNVIAGRGKRLQITDETFSGLFWTGRQAKKMGLIDDFGSIRAPLKALPRVVYSRDENLLEQLNKQLAESMIHELFSQLVALSSSTVINL